MSDQAMVPASSANMPAKSQDIQDSQKAKDNLFDNPSPVLRFGMIVALLLVVGFGGWLIFFSLSGAVIATGKVTVDSNKKLVQHLSGGIVKDIMVREGQIVKEGEVVLRLDGTQKKAEYASMISELRELETREARLLAERDNKSKITYPPYLVEESETNSEVREVITGQTSLFYARRDTLLGEEKLLNKKTEQYNTQIKGLNVQYEANERQLKLLEEEIAGLRTLYKKGYAPKTRILALEREKERLAGQQGDVISSMARAETAIAETELEVLQKKHDFRENVLSELRDIQTRVYQLREQRLSLKDELNRLDILAPNSGKVFELTAHTLGGIIAPGDPVMQIVPANDELVIEAQVAPKDIDKVLPGLNVNIRFPAFNQRTTPQLNGTLEYVSGDSVVDEQKGVSYFIARILITAEERKKISHLDLLPGMPAEVYINTGDRTALSYFMKPLTDSINRTFREE